MRDSRLYLGPIYVKKSAVHGYGVFAAQDLAADEIIEECHALIYREERDLLRNYSFAWEDQSAIPLGFGCIYNHSSKPNIDYTNDLDRGLIVFRTLTAIRQGEELFSSYGKHWFDRRKLKMKSKSPWRALFQNRLLLRASLMIGGLYTCLYALHHF